MHRSLPLVPASIANILHAFNKHMYMQQVTIIVLPLVTPAVILRLNEVKLLMSTQCRHAVGNVAQPATGTVTIAAALIGVTALLQSW